jgi:threonyl-tRNA synthetase
MKHINKIILLATATILFTACQKDDEGNHVTYYKTIGEGYIYDATNNVPLTEAKITVISTY